MSLRIRDIRTWSRYSGRDNSYRDYADDSEYDDHGYDHRPGWEHIVDNEFAYQLQTGLRESQRPLLLPEEFSTLCNRCVNLQVPSDTVDFDVCELQRGSQSCTLCKMLLESVNSPIPTETKSIKFRRHRSKLEPDGHSGSGLAIIVSPETRFKLASIQFGFPVLHEVGSPNHFALLNEWLQYCDENHPNCLHRKHDQPRLLPTRVLDVGSKEEPNLRLHEPGRQEEERYVILSHRWGDPTEAQKAKFCTYACNIEERKRGINFDDLPKNFQHAVVVARELRVRYLWIDSMCIEQKHNNCSCKSDDWKNECEKMKDYYGSAYCTVAADSAGGPNGLFRPAQARRYVRLPNETDAAVYLCEDIDDFDRDVDRGHLNTRGWVFQERALSQRTIHYTNTQTYWSCGQGIRCETLSALRPPHGYRLNHPQFPSVRYLAPEYSSFKIFQQAFQQYSQLSLTQRSDRSVAISGVAEALAGMFHTKQAYGIFVGMFHATYIQTASYQSLLWRRCGEKRPLEEKTNPNIPSWSWMAYVGGIDYVDISRGFKGNQITPLGDPEAPRELEMELREPEIKLNWKDVNEDGQQLTFDGESSGKNNDELAQELKFALVGHDDDGKGEKLVYVLIVQKDSSEDKYRRVGVGRVSDRYMSDISEVLKVSLI